ncbi:MAG: DUF996 domain-containing protein [Candidatus Bathyarchaeota archaeon]|nr:DUF996 domain-containing protein [Candidatus Bathyarchaeota archaeon]
MPVETNRMLGGVGAAFTVVGAVGTVISLFSYGDLSAGGITSTSLGLSAVSGVAGFVAFIGFILFLIAMYGFSNDYQERRIFSYIIYGIIAAIISAVVALGVMFMVLFSNIAALIPSFDPSQPPSQSDIMSQILPSITPIIAVFAVVGVALVVLEVLAFRLLAKKSEVPLFRMGGLILLTGSVLSVAIGVTFAVFAATGSLDYRMLSILGAPGGLVQQAGWVVLAFAFFRIKPPPQQVLNPASEVSYCSHCGAQNPSDATYCIRCGQKQQSTI